MAEIPDGHALVADLGSGQQARIDHKGRIATREMKDLTSIEETCETFAVEKQINIQKLLFLGETASYLCKMKMCPFPFTADPNIQNYEGASALHMAAGNGNYEVVHFLVEHGAAVNQCTQDGQTALHLATVKGIEEVVRTLIKHGAHYNVTDHEGDTALHYAVRESKENILKLLVEQGANVNLPNEDDETPLELAVCLGEHNIANFLARVSKVEAMTH